MVGDADGVRAPCTRCGKTWPQKTSACLACGAEFGDETGQTILDDVHARETFLLGARRGATTDTVHAGRVAVADATRVEINLPSESELPSFAERTDEEIDHLTVVAPRRPSVANPAPLGGSSSDPPTRFLRGIDQHIELPSGSVVDDYEIEAKLGAGAMGVVYAARHVKLGRRVAIKVIAPTMGDDPQALARFEREARALAALHHPNIVDVYAFGTLPDGRSYFVMELLSGDALDERLARGRMSLYEALDVLDQIARALEAAHAQGIVHRDLKPSNTFLLRIPREQRSVVKLLDLGLIKWVVADDAEKTASDAVIGTALYLSPEQARGPNVDGRTDIYAAGCIAYELVLGRHPFPEARTATAAIAAHLTEPAPQPKTIWPGIPAALDLLLSSMVAKDPSYRPTLAQVRNVIASVRSPTTAGRAMPAWIVALVAFALFAGIAIGASVLGGKSSNGDALDAMPVGDGATSFSGSEAVAPVKPDSRAAAVVAAKVDAGVDASAVGIAPIRSQVTGTTRSAKPKSPTAADIDAGVSSAPLMPAVLDAGSRDTPPPSEVVKPHITPAVTEKPVQRPLPQSPTNPAGRDVTINPFAKRGSAGR